MTHAPHFPAGMMHVQLSAAVLDDGRFVASASSAHSRIAAIVAGSSIATTVSLSPDTPCCSSAPSDALVETPFRIPSTDTLGFAAAALAASCLACYPVVDSVDELLDLDRGSWEGSLPDSSSLGEDGTPLRGAFIIDSASLTGFQELTAGKTLSILREWRILIAIDLRQPGPLWSAKLAQSYAAADIVHSYRNSFHIAKYITVTGCPYLSQRLSGESLVGIHTSFVAPEVRISAAEKTVRARCRIVDVPVVRSCPQPGSPCAAG